MSELVEISDSDGWYARFRAAQPPRWQARQAVDRLGERLAGATAERLARCGVAEDRVLCAVLLRGGALLYPAFASRLPGADFTLLGLQRQPSGTVACSYLSNVPQSRYDRIVYVDCVAATGRTLLAARMALAQHCLSGGDLAALICSSTPATELVAAAGYDVVGFSLWEAVDGGIVSPDLGELDAGDLFSSPVAERHRDPAGRR